MRYNFNGKSINIPDAEINENPWNVKRRGN